MIEEHGHRNLLVPVEDSEVHVVPVGQSHLFAPDSNEDPELQVEKARAMLQSRFVSHLDAAKVESHVSVLRGSSASCDEVGALICDKAESVGAALIVMAAHNKGALARLVVGSVTKFCLDHSTTSVLLMRTG